MLMFDDRFQDRRRANFSLRAKRMCALDHGPAIIATTLDMKDRFPEVLTHVAGPEFAGVAVKAHFPDVAEAVSRNLGPCPLHVAERIIFRNGVCLLALGVIDVDAMDRGLEVGDVLAAGIAVGIAAP